MGQHNLRVKVTVTLLHSDQEISYSPGVEHVARTNVYDRRRHVENAIDAAVRQIQKKAPDLMEVVNATWGDTDEDDEESGGAS